MDTSSKEGHAPVTEAMEKGMQQSHGISYSEYNRSLNKRIEIEKQREKDYEASKKIAAQFS